jgi:hypothetical protein
MSEMRNAHEVLLENLYIRYGWELNMKIDLTGRGWEGVDWINVAEDRVQYMLL